jgi:hypothetical protein
LLNWIVQKQALNGLAPYFKSPSARSGSNLDPALGDTISRALGDRLNVKFLKVKKLKATARLLFLALEKLNRGPRLSLVWSQKVGRRNAKSTSGIRGYFTALVRFSSSRKNKLSLIEFDSNWLQLSKWS